VLSEAISLARCVQLAVRLPATSRVKTYTDPLLEIFVFKPSASSFQAPITIVSPSSAMLHPNQSLAALSEASSFAICEMLKCVGCRGCVNFLLGARRRVGDPVGAEEAVNL
jgi:hypothetical protein